MDIFSKRYAMFLFVRKEIGIFPVLGVWYGQQSYFWCLDSILAFEILILAFVPHPVNALERSRGRVGRLLLWRADLEACLWWNQLGKQQQKGVAQSTPRPSQTWFHKFIRIVSVQQIVDYSNRFCEPNPESGSPEPGCHSRRGPARNVCSFNVPFLTIHKATVSSLPFFVLCALSGFRDRLIPQRSGMWVNSGTVGR